MMVFKWLFFDLKHIQKGYRIEDRITMTLHILLPYVLLPITVILKTKIQTKKILPPFAVKTKDGLFYCRDRLDLGVVIEENEPALRRYFESFRDGVFVDIGSHIGKYTIMVGKKLRKGKIVSLEAHPETFQFLLRNISLNKCRNILPRQLAVWNKKTYITFYEHESSAEHSAVVKSGRKVTVRADTVDNILEANGVRGVKLVKIDVEGAEREVLRGMKKTLNVDGPTIIFESFKNIDYIRKFLGRYGYRIENLDGNNWLARRRRR